jgi:hypothetical protein
MNRKHAFVEFQYDELAVAPNRFYKLITDAPPQHGEFLAHYVMRRKLSVHNAAPRELGCQRSNYRFDFG